MPETHVTVVFAGPSMPKDAQRHADGIEWRPPARRGDLANLDLAAGSRVLLIDGLLIQDHPPSPSEVAGLVDRGYEVWGCSSLGALRAVELRNHGVRGHGWVYQRILDRTITFDDELVAPLDPRTGAAAGVFVANLRYGLERLCGSGRASAHQAQAIVEEVTSIHYEERTVTRCREIAAANGLDVDALDRLIASDIKRIDADGLIALVVERRL